MLFSQAIAFAFDRHDVAVVEQAVKDGRGDHLVPEHLAPGPKFLVQNSEHFVGGGTELMVWVGAAVPTGLKFHTNSAGIPSPCLGFRGVGVLGF